MKRDNGNWFIGIASIFMLGWIAGMVTYEVGFVDCAAADITDPAVEPAETAAQAAIYIRQRVVASLNSDAREMQAVNAKLVEHTTAAIATELGDDATQMQTIYNAKKAMNLAIFGPEGTNPNPSKVIPAIP